jgi:hypothetical protein
MLSTGGWSVTIVVVVALAGLIALLVAILTGNTLAAIGVVALAALGIVLLLRDWRADRRQTPEPDAPVDVEVSDPEPVETAMSPEMFAPDIPTDGAGPSSDARAD